MLFCCWSNTSAYLIVKVISYRIGLETTDMEIHSDDIQTLVETQHRLLKNMPHLRRLHTFPNANNLDAIINPLKSLHVKMVHNFDFTMYCLSTLFGSPMSWHADQALDGPFFFHLHSPLRYAFILTGLFEYAFAAILRVQILL